MSATGLPDDPGQWLEATLSGVTLCPHWLSLDAWWHFWEGLYFSIPEDFCGLMCPHIQSWTQQQTTQNPHKNQRMTRTLSNSPFIEQNDLRDLGNSGFIGRSFLFAFPFSESYLCISQSFKYKVLQPSSGTIWILSSHGVWVVMICILFLSRLMKYLSWVPPPCHPHTPTLPPFAPSLISFFPLASSRSMSSTSGPSPTWHGRHRNVDDTRLLESGAHGHSTRPAVTNVPRTAVSRPPKHLTLLLCKQLAWITWWCGQKGGHFPSQLQGRSYWKGERTENLFLPFYWLIHSELKPTWGFNSF